MNKSKHTHAQDVHANARMYVSVENATAYHPSIRSQSLSPVATAAAVYMCYMVIFHMCAAAGAIKTDVYMLHVTGVLGRMCSIDLLVDVDACLMSLLHIMASPTSFVASQISKYILHLCREKRAHGTILRDIWIFYHLLESVVMY